MIESEQPEPGKRGPEARLQIIDLAKFSSVDFEAPIAEAGSGQGRGATGDWGL